MSGNVEVLLTASMQAGLWSSSHIEPHLPMTCMNLEVDASPKLPDKCPSQLAPWGMRGSVEPWSEP